MSTIENTSRRRFLKGVLAGTLLAHVPPILSGCLKAAKQERETQTLSTRYLEEGLAGLANAGRSGHWDRGHYGAAAIAGYFFALEHPLDKRTRTALQTELDIFVADPSRFPKSDPPEGEANPDEIQKIVKELESRIDVCRNGGHHVIFSALALKALRKAPTLATPSTIEGICKLLQLIHRGNAMEDTAFNKANPIPRYQTPREMMQSVLSCFLKPAYLGQDAGINTVGLIHIVTTADALAEFWEMGYESLAMRGGEAMKICINRPAPTKGKAADSYTACPASPLTHAFWESPDVRKMEWGFRGHFFKFPYSYYRQRKVLTDAAMLKRCDERALLVLGGEL